jgi:hypothetical protein
MPEQHLPPALPGCRTGAQRNEAIDAEKISPYALLSPPERHARSAKDGRHVGRCAPELYLRLISPPTSPAEASLTFCRPLHKTALEVSVMISYRREYEHPNIVKSGRRRLPPNTVVPGAELNGASSAVLT